MFNVCILSGPVLSEPRFYHFESGPEAMFELGISLGPYKAGYIKVNCPQNLAAVAVDSIHRGDRVAVVGVIGRYANEDLEIEGELVIVAKDLELVRRDSPTLGLRTL